VSGDLEQKLITTALRLLETAPPERLSLRRVAQEAGVSHQAPYVHFVSKRGFLAAVAGTGLQRASIAAADALNAAGDDPLLRLHAFTDAYVAFISAHPHVHDLAYGQLVAKSDHPFLQQAAIAYWDLLHDTVAKCQPPGIEDAEVLRRCAAIWGTVYGIARLATMRQIPTSVPGNNDDLLQGVVDSLYQSWQGRPDRDSHQAFLTSP
jgi:AcrR family transcriptional regulator